MGASMQTPFHGPAERGKVIGTGMGAVPESTEEAMRTATGRGTESRGTAPETLPTGEMIGHGG